VDTCENGQTQRRRGRRHSAEFKAHVVATCRTPGTSIAALALERSLNANLLRDVLERLPTQPASRIGELLHIIGLRR